MKTLSTALQVKNAEAGLYRVAGATGLYFKVGSSGAGSYYVRYRLGDKRPSMGLGSADDVGLADARKAADNAVKLAREGIDPIAERKRARAANLARKGPVLFKEAAEACAEAHGGVWKNRTPVAWLRPLIRYGYPILAELDVNAIMPEHIAAIRRAADAKGFPAAGRSVQGQVKMVLDYAAVMEWRDPNARNPADAQRIAKVHPVKHKRESFRCVLLDDAPATFRAAMEAAERMSGTARTSLDAWALIVSCGLRAREGLNLQWREVDLNGHLLTIEAWRMKGGGAHAVPLSTMAMSVLERRALTGVDGYVFAGRDGTPVGWGTFHRALKTLKETGVDTATVHGWRATFMDYALDIARSDFHVVEAALSHVLPPVQRAYKRETCVEIRRLLMQRYADWLTGVEAKIVAFPTPARA